MLGFERKQRQKLRSEACCFWSVDKISAFSAKNTRGWGVYENRDVWSRKNK